VSRLSKPPTEEEFKAWVISEWFAPGFVSWRVPVLAEGNLAVGYVQDTGVFSATVVWIAHSGDSVGETWTLWGGCRCRHVDEYDAWGCVAANGVRDMVEAYLRRGEQMTVELALAPVRREGASFVEIYKGDNNGAFMIQTNHADPDSFLEQAGERLLATLNELQGDEDFTMSHALPLICAVWAKLKGYRSEGVVEQKLLTAGDPQPGELRRVA
jgi:hypothetical protein